MTEQLFADQPACCLSNHQIVLPDHESIIRKLFALTYRHQLLVPIMDQTHPMAPDIAENESMREGRGESSQTMQTDRSDANEVSYLGLPKAC